MAREGNRDFRKALQESTARAEKKGIAKGAIGGAIAGAAAVLVSSAIINGIAGIGEGAEDPYKKQPVSSTSIGMQSKSVKDIKGLYEFLGPIYPGKEKVQEATGKIVNVSLNTIHELFREGTEYEGRITVDARADGIFIKYGNNEVRTEGELNRIITEIVRMQTIEEDCKAGKRKKSAELALYNYEKDLLKEIDQVAAAKVKVNGGIANIDYITIEEYEKMLKDREIGE